MKKTLLAASIASIIAQTALAEDAITLEEITINADFRETTESEVAPSTDVISPETANQKNAQHLEDVLATTSNVNVSSGASRAGYFQIRGIGERSQYNTPLNPSVGLLVDGVDLSRTGAAAQLFDTQSVTVFKGPQGTQFGSSALAGVIAIESNEPTDTFEGYADMGMGSNQSSQMGVVVGGPLSETLSARIALQQFKTDGYMKNTYLDRDDTQNQDEALARLSLKWKASDDVTVDYKLTYLEKNNGYDAFSFENDFTTITDEPGKDELDLTTHVLKVAYDKPTTHTTEFSMTQSEAQVDYGYDDDWTNATPEWLNAGNWGGYSAYDRYVRQRDNNGFDFRQISKEDGRLFNGNADWVWGLSYLNQKEGLDRTYAYLDNGPFSSDYNTKNTALYGQLDIAASAKTTYQVGARIERFEADYSDNYDTSSETSETLYGGKLGLKHQLNTNHLAFASLSRGYKAGGVNNDGSLPADDMPFDTEYLWNLEAGLNSSTLNGKLKTRLTAFYTKRKDQQVNSSTQKQDSQDFTIYLSNAAEGTHYGVELDANYQASNSVTLYSSIGLLKATFDDYTYVDPNNSTNTVSLNGREQAHAPNYQFNVGAEYVVTENTIFNMNVEGKDGFYYSNSHEQKSQAYQLLNASVEHFAGQWTFTLWGRNLTDQYYTTRGFFFGIDPRTDYSDGLYTQQGEPRTVGVKACYDF